MRHRLRIPLMLLLVLSLPLLGGALPVGADEPIDGLLRDLLPDDPAPIPGAVSISAGGGHTCAVTVTHEAYCWGDNADGQLGNGTTTSSSTPVKVSTGAGLTAGTVATITAGWDHTCATTTTGDAYCWGDNGIGQIGNGTATDSSTPVKVSTGAGLTPGTVDTITAGGYHTCATTTTGDAYCWGYNPSGQLGNGTTTTISSTPVKVSTGAGLTPGNVATITAGGYHTCATTTTGDAYCWGNNGHGRLGNGTTAQSNSTPVKVSTGTGLTPGTVATITAGDDHTCAATTTGDAYCWGYNSFGQLGNGTTTYSTTPVQVSTGAGLTPGMVATITGGGRHTCATIAAGDAYCWGDNGSGRLGDGTTTGSTTPAKVSTGAGLTPGTVATVTAGGIHSCATSTTGDAYCWGDNASGQLGDGTTTSSSTPVRVQPMLVPTPKHCDDDSTRVDRVDWSNGANTFSVDVHEKGDGVYTCVYAERNGDVLVDEVVRVRGDVITVEEDAPPGNGPDSPCTEDHGEGGTSTNRAYVRSTPSDAYPAAVCAGITTGAGNRHVRVHIG